MSRNDKQKKYSFMKGDETFCQLTAHTERPKSSLASEELRQKRLPATWKIINECRLFSASSASHLNVGRERIMSPENISWHKNGLHNNVFVSNAFTTMKTISVINQM